MRLIIFFCLIFLVLFSVITIGCKPTEDIRPPQFSKKTDSSTPQTKLPVVSPTSWVIPRTPLPGRLLEAGDEPIPPAGVLDTTKTYKAIMTTEKGEIVIELFDDIASIYVENFINLSRIGFYDDVTFHRVIEGFMAQAGDPTGTGSGGPGYRFNDQFHVDMKHNVGVISMANSGFNTNGSQFFITFEAPTFLDPYNPDGTPKKCSIPGTSCHAVFGKVIKGMDVLRSIRLRDPSNDPKPGDRILTIEIEES